MKYTIKIERSECTACENCYSIDPAHFEGDEEGISYIVGGDTTEDISSGKFDDDDIEDAREAADSCPVEIIFVEEL